MAARRNEKKGADTLDSCVKKAIMRTSQAIERLEVDGGKDSVANLAKLVSVIGELRDMVGGADEGQGQTGVILIPERKEQ